MIFIALNGDETLQQPWFYHIIFGCCFLFMKDWTVAIMIADVCVCVYSVKYKSK